MTLNLSVPEPQDLKPRITVFGVGGAGGNAVNNMIEQELDGVEFVVANTDAQALAQSKSGRRIQMGIKVTEGLGAGARPEVGAKAAEETIEEIIDHLAGAHMCFITAGMGGGTGTGAAPIIAQAARELGVLTVGVVTKPFQFEGAKRMRQANEGIDALQKVVDTLIIIPNQNLFRLANEKTTFTQAFAMADDVLYQGVKGVTDLMVRPGLINLDFADVRAVMDEMGKAMMGTGEASGEDRAVQAAEKAINNPLLDEISLKGAKGVLINITGGADLTLFELDEAANRIREEVDEDANIIVGSTLDPSMEGMMRVAVVATGIDVTAAQAAEHSSNRRAAEAVSREPAPQPSPEPVIEEREEAPVFAHRQQREEPTLFPEFDPAQHAEDDLPAPAYQPQRRNEYPLNARADEYVAPQPTRAAGAPSPEAINRLQSALSVSRMTQAPRAAQPQPTPAPQPRAPEPRMQERAPERAERAPEPAEAPKSRFGLNGLLGRMTGGQSTPEPTLKDALQAQHIRRPQANEPPMHAEQPRDEEQDRIEIPAFLRRQAN